MNVDAVRDGGIDGVFCWLLITNRALVNNVRNGYSSCE
jgi:hypothetical protein